MTLMLSVPSEMVRELLVTTKRSVIHTAQLVYGSMETRRQSHQPSDESAAAGSQHAIARTCACRATGSGQMRLYVRRRYGPSFLQFIGAVEDLEVTTDSGMSRAPFQLFAEGQIIRTKIQVATETDPMEAEQ